MGLRTALCHLRTVRIPFATNRNLSVFWKNTKRTGCVGCLFHAPGVLCSPQVRGKLINCAPLTSRMRMVQRISNVLVYTKLNTHDILLVLKIVSWSWDEISWPNFIFIILNGMKILSAIRCAIDIRFNARFTFSLRQHETRREWEFEWYIRLVFHTLDLFSSCPEALGDMSVNQSRVKGNEDISNVLPCYRQFSHESSVARCTDLSVHVQIFWTVKKIRILAKIRIFLVKYGFFYLNFHEKGIFHTEFFR